MSKKQWIDPATGKVWPDRRLERINDERMDRVYGSYRLLNAYANPLRAGMPLSSTEITAVTRATKILRGTP